jgi:DNA-binding response OmpR family regulator
MKKNILIVEDDEFFRELISKKLISSGFNVLGSMDGQSGIEKARKEKPDLILLDLLLPTTNGFDVLSALKADSGTVAIPVIILSNLDSKEDIEKGLKSGASDFLIKSQIDVDQVIEKVNGLLKN